MKNIISAIEWLNCKTTEDNIFLIEIHAYKIGDSLPAPKFEVVENPMISSNNKKEIQGAGN